MKWEGMMNDVYIIIIIGLIKPPNGLLILANIIFYYNVRGVMRDRCIVLGEEGSVRYTILKVGKDIGVGSIV